MIKYLMLYKYKSNYHLIQGTSKQDMIDLVVELEGAEILFIGHEGNLLSCGCYGGKAPNLLGTEPFKLRQDN